MFSDGPVLGIEKSFPARHNSPPVCFCPGGNFEEALIADGLAGRPDFPFGSDGFRPPTNEFIDGIEYDGRRPNAYLTKFAIGMKDTEHAQ